MSPQQTTGVGLGVAGLAALILYLTHWPIQPMPNDVAIYIAGVLPGVGHATYAWLSARFPAKQSAPDPAPLPAPAAPAEASPAEAPKP